MSFPRYPRYKASGVEWLGEVPEHWEVFPFKRFVAIPITDGPHETPQFLDEGVPFVSAEAISSGRIEFSKVRACISAEDNVRYSLKYSPKLHDIYMVKSGATTGITAIVEDRADFNIWSPLAVIRCGEKADPHFVLSFMRSRNFLDAITLNWSFGTQQNIGMGVIENLSCTMPPLGEQTAIAAFLDRETGKIDALVAEQQRLIELLKEKRQAVISHAVTKGLNPNARLKPSGIEWLGEVPEHWEVRRFQRCVFVAEGQVDPEMPEYSAMPLIAPNHIESGSGRLMDLETASEQGAESGKYLCMEGDVVYSKIRPALRKVTIAPVRCLCSADMYPLRAHSGLINPFLLWYMLSEQFSALAVLESERVAMPKINRESLKEVMLVLPQPDEQTDIVDFLTAETAKFDTLTAEAQRAIDLLQERRTALISAAVTGQIDVRQI